ncbi:histidine kinase [Paenibacillus yonginensis]|uniref:Histidine kinase n=1 Tax=Paenibacillus yonginensis TaxID=1462996 RepID=A0A1B1MX08_9BACL|nr:HD-GYP domain-containing protein [Paenibacillus yonginensis]ANS73721.1 histidine kinase [Paenibacillus yonginensis]
MRLLPVKSLQPGMRLAQKIYNDDGLILLSDEVELTASLIKRLSSLGIDFVYISDPRTQDIQIPELISAETERMAIQELRTNFLKISNHSLKGLVYPYLGKAFLNVVESIMKDLGSRDNVLIMLGNIHTADHTLFRHSLNVCIYTLMLGKAFGYSQRELTVLGLGAVLHDIGKVKIDPAILHKPERLSQVEFEVMKQHAEIGYRMLKDEPGIPLQAAHCAYQHHERIDGSGYPRGLMGSDIHEYAQWISIADSYDAMTSQRVYNQALLPHQAVEILYAGCGTLYDKQKLEIFRDHVAIYPLGMTVVLNTGEVGVVSRIHPFAPQRPVVRVLYGPGHEELQTPYELDLMKKLNLVITGIDNESALPKLEQV